MENRGQQSQEHSQVWVKVKLPGFCGLGLSQKPSTSEGWGGLELSSLTMRLTL